MVKNVFYRWRDLLYIPKLVLHRKKAKKEATQKEASNLHIIGEVIVLTVAEQVAKKVTYKRL
jgi:hypothetical protein